MNCSTHIPARPSRVFPKYSQWTFLLVLALVTVFAPGSGMAATADEIFAAVHQQVAVNPGQAGQILKRTLEALPKAERQRLAAGIFAATLKGLGTPSVSDALRLFKIAFDASPDSGAALLVAAHAAFPANLSAFMETAIKAASANGRTDLIPCAVARAVALAPDQQRAGLTALALGLVPEPLGARVLDAIARFVPGGPCGIPGSRGIGRHDQSHEYRRQQYQLP